MSNKKLLKVNDNRKDNVKMKKTLDVMSTGTVEEKTNFYNKLLKIENSDFVFAKIDAGGVQIYLSSLSYKKYVKRKLNMLVKHNGRGGFRLTIRYGELIDIIKNLGFIQITENITIIHSDDRNSYSICEIWRRPDQTDYWKKLSPLILGVGDAKRCNEEMNSDEQ